MNRKHIGLGGLVAALLCLGSVRAQDMPAPYTGAGGSLSRPVGRRTALRRPGAPPACRACGSDHGPAVELDGLPALSRLLWADRS